jgi:hypothetical protein
MNLFKRNTPKAWSTDKYFYKDTRAGISCATTIKPGKRTTPEAFGTYSTCQIRRRHWDGGAKCIGHYSGPDADRNYCPDCGGPVIKWVDPERRRREIAEEERRKREYALKKAEEERKHQEWLAEQKRKDQERQEWLKTPEGRKWQEERAKTPTPSTSSTPTRSSSSGIGSGVKGRLPGIGGHVQHDPVTGRISSIGSQHVQHDPVTNRITNIGGQHVQYDVHGRMLNVGGQHVQHDVFGKILSIGGKHVQYDVHGRILRIG